VIGHAFLFSKKSIYPISPQLDLPITAVTLFRAPFPGWFISCNIGDFLENVVARLKPEPHPDSRFHFRQRVRVNETLWSFIVPRHAVSWEGAGRAAN
jgi:hypothetical protein